ncbi:MAG: hypothetical protein WC346_08630, partial [Methanogenium sp.]
MDRYWVGGTGNWDASTTTNWSDSDGGSGGFSVPTSSDNVYFTANSGGGICTVTVNVSCNDLDFTGYTGTFAGSSSRYLYVYGSLTMDSTMTRTYAGRIYLEATTSGKTLTFNGLVMKNDVYFNGVGGEWTIQDEWNNTSGFSGGDITLNNGTLISNDQTITCAYFASSNSNVRTLTLGSSTINCYYWNFGTITNLTFNVGTSTINSNGTTFASGGLAYKTVVLESSGAYSRGVTGTGVSFDDLTFQITSSSGRFWYLSNDIIVNNSLTISGYSQNRYRLSIYGSGAQRTITCNGSVSMSNVDFRDIIGSGSATWTGTSIGNNGNNSGITFTTPVNRYWIGDAGYWYDTAHWSDSSGGSGGATYPICHDTAIFDANSFSTGSQTVTMPDQYIWICKLDCSDVTNSPTLNFSSSQQRLTGDLILGSGVNLTASSLYMNPVDGSTRYIQCNGGTVSVSTLALVSDATFQLLDDFVGISIDHQEGTFDANNHDLTLSGGFQSVTSSTRTIHMGSGMWQLGYWYVTSSNLTLDTGTSTIKLVGTAGVFLNDNGTGVTYPTVWVYSSGTDYAYILYSNSITTLKVEPGLTLWFWSGYSQTITNFDAVGTVGNMITLLSDGTWNLIKSGSGQISCDYLDISYSAASPADTWYAGVNSNNTTGNSGWVFDTPGWKLSQSESLSIDESRKTESELTLTKNESYSLLEASKSASTKQKIDSLILAELRNNSSGISKNLSDDLQLSPKEFDIQRGTQTLSAGVSTATIDLATPVKVGKSFPIVSFQSDNYRTSRSMATATLQTEVDGCYTQLYIRRSYSTDTTAIYRWQVITGRNFNVQTFEKAMSSQNEQDQTI